MTRAHYNVEVVRRSEVRKGDVLLHITRGKLYELVVESDQTPLGDFATEVQVRWPGDSRTRGFSLGERGATHLRRSRVVPVFGVWEHEYEHDKLIGLFWDEDAAKAKAASNPKGNLGGQWPDNRGDWTVEEHTIA